MDQSAGASSSAPTLHLPLSAAQVMFGGAMSGSNGPVSRRLEDAVLKAACRELYGSRLLTQREFDQVYEQYEVMCQRCADGEEQVDLAFVMPHADAVVPPRLRVIRPFGEVPSDDDDIRQRDYQHQHHHSQRSEQSPPHARITNQCRLPQVTGIPRGGTQFLRTNPRASVDRPAHAAPTVSPATAAVAAAAPIPPNRDRVPPVAPAAQPNPQPARAHAAAIIALRLTFVTLRLIRAHLLAHLIQLILFGATIYFMFDSFALHFIVLLIALKVITFVSQRVTIRADARPAARGAAPAWPPGEGGLPAAGAAGAAGAGGEHAADAHEHAPAMVPWYQRPRHERLRYLIFKSIVTFFVSISPTFSLVGLKNELEHDGVPTNDDVANANGAAAVPPN